MLKLAVRKEKTTEVPVEFWLKEAADGSIRLCCGQGEVTSGGHILRITPGGRICLIGDINEEFGLSLDGCGRIQIENFD